MRNLFLIPGWGGEGFRLERREEKWLELVPLCAQELQREGAESQHSCYTAPHSMLGRADVLTRSRL